MSERASIVLRNRRSGVLGLILCLHMVRKRGVGLKSMGWTDELGCTDNELLLGFVALPWEWRCSQLALKEKHLHPHHLNQDVCLSPNSQSKEIGEFLHLLALTVSHQSCTLQDSKSFTVVQWLFCRCVEPMVWPAFCQFKKVFALLETTVLMVQVSFQCISQWTYFWMCWKRAA